MISGQTGDGPRRVLVVSNGHGEDAIGAELVRMLPKNRFAVAAYPIVGPGRAYEGLCPRVGPRADIPSAGWRHTKGSVARDLGGGMLQSVGPALNFLRAAKAGYDRVVVIGDGVGPLLAFLSGLKIDIYLDVFKSGYAHTYKGLERFVLRRAARTVFCRDNMLAERLRKAGIDGRSAGNVMLDTVPDAPYDIAARRTRPLAVTLLPGSRETTAESLAMQVAALHLLPADLRPDIFVAVAGGIAPGDLATATDLVHTPPDSGEKTDLGRLSGQGLDLHLARGAALKTLIAEADLVLAQAGTATQQALGLGKPAITFDRADNRRKRMANEQALMGQARILTAQSPEALADATAGLLRDKGERQRLGAIGQHRLGGPGTLAAVLQVLDA